MSGLAGSDLVQMAAAVAIVIFSCSVFSARRRLRRVEINRILRLEFDASHDDPSAQAE